MEHVGTEEIVPYHLYVPLLEGSLLKVLLYNANVAAQNWQFTCQLRNISNGENLSTPVSREQLPKQNKKSSHACAN